MLRDGSEMVASGLLCTVGLGTIMETPYNFTYGDLVQAQIADVMNGLIETDLSVLGGTAVIPDLAAFIAVASTWNGDYQQTTFASIRDGTFVKERDSMTFESMFVGDNVVAGEGTDTNGHFLVAGIRDGLEVAFTKTYTDAEGQGAQDWWQYEGTIDKIEMNIGGQFQAYQNGEKRVFTANGVVYDTYGTNPYNDRFTLWRY